MLGVSIYGGFRYYKHYFRSALERDSLARAGAKLRDKVLKMWKKGTDSPASIFFTPTVSSQAEEGGVAWEIKVQK